MVIHTVAGGRDGGQGTGLDGGLALSSSRLGRDDGQGRKGGEGSDRLHCEDVCEGTKVKSQKPKVMIRKCQAIECSERVRNNWM